MSAGLVCHRVQLARPLSGSSDAFLVRHCPDTGLKGCGVARGVPRPQSVGTDGGAIRVKSVEAIGKTNFPAQKLAHVPLVRF